jgi:hypothetical protein
LLGWARLKAEFQRYFESVLWVKILIIPWLLFFNRGMEYHGSLLLSLLIISTVRTVWIINSYIWFFYRIGCPSFVILLLNEILLALCQQNVILERLKTSQHKIIYMQCT